MIELLGFFFIGLCARSVPEFISGMLGGMLIYFGATSGIAIL